MYTLGLSVIGDEAITEERIRLRRTHHPGSYREVFTKYDKPLTAWISCSCTGRNEIVLEVPHLKPVGDYRLIMNVIHDEFRSALTARDEISGTQVIWTAHERYVLTRQARKVQTYILP